jgi:hypothetical protein
MNRSRAAKGAEKRNIVQRKGLEMIKCLGVLLSLCLTVCILPSCGNGDGNGGEEVQACRDLADAYGDMCVRCQVLTYQECYDAVIQVVNGDCDNVKQIRDINLFYNTCIPWIQSVDCAYVTSDTFELDSSCQSQLLM